MASDLIRYDLLVQDALRAVMRKVLADAAREGLPGDHHFFITFRTRAAGVRLSNRMREQYPNEMTIILQHQFWDLNVGDQAFEVGLSFHGKSETLLIPFDAVTGFFDPSVEFGLKFELAAEAAEQLTAPPSEALPAPQKPLAQAPARTLDKARPRGSGSEPAEVGPALAKDQAAPAKPGKAATPRPAEQAKVVSIETFRKKP
ncbi:MAG TPA: ClpXP protease specificity-enhancing factor SspB [Methylovirgula sp.]|nr:ClpXP protease specificity-enhancing factor SspB [Methylovirgula sp.]